MLMLKRILILVVLIGMESGCGGVATSDQAQEANREKLRQSARASTKIGTKNGRVLSKGDGDNLLRRHNNLVPPSRTTESTPPLRKTGHALHGFEAVKANVDMLQADRHDSAVLLSQTIPGSDLKKFYIVQFEAQPNGHPGPAWRPLFVIAWKATTIVSSVPIDFVFRRPKRTNSMPIEYVLLPMADITIFGHLVRPPSTKNAIYALKPDHSLEQISLTKEETARLFSRITDVEKRQDQRLAHLVRFIKRKDPRWKESLSALRANEGLFPSDPYWEQKVDPHLKVVEPPKERGK